MGAWGMGVYDDDTSCDLLDDALEEKAESFISRAIEHKSLDYIEYEECHEIIVSGALIDAICNGTKYDTESENYQKWLSVQNKEALNKYRPDIILGLNRVLSSDSELNELWEENEDDYPEWKANIESIIRAISA